MMAKKLTEEECKALEKYDQERFKQGQLAAKFKERMKIDKRAREMIVSAISEATGWTEDECERLFSKIQAIDPLTRRHYAGELMAIARDIGHEIGIPIQGRGQASVVIQALLQDDDDDGDEDEHQPQDLDELITA